MKRSLKLIVIFSILLLPIFVQAGSISVNKGSLNIKPGGKASFVIKASEAAGRVDISSSDSSVATVSSSSAWLDNDSKTITVTGKSEGSATISVVLTDAAGYDGKVLNGTYNVKVNVKAPEVDNRSSNNNLDRLDVEGYEIEKVDDNTFSLSVKNSVTSVNIIATAQDSKASVAGTGSVELAVGDNSFNVVVTAENGSKKTYTINIYRKDNKYGLEDIDDALNSGDSIDIILKDDDVITKDILEKIKNSKKVVHFNMYSGEKLLYSWIIDGSKLDRIEEIKPNISFEVKEDFEKETNYASGIYVTFNSTNLGEGITVRFFVSEKFKDGEKINVYTYKDDKVVLVDEGVEIKDGYLELIPSNEDYLLTKASFEDSKEVTKGKKFNPFILTTVLETIAIGGIGASVLIKKKKISKQI